MSYNKKLKDIMKLINSEGDDYGDKYQYSNDKNEKKEREILNSKTPERIIILTKRAPQNTIKNVFKHYRSPPIIYQPENGDNLIKKKRE